MTNYLNTLLAPIAIDTRLRGAEKHRDKRVYTYTMPLVRENPRPVGPGALDGSSW